MRPPRFPRARLSRQLDDERSRGASRKLVQKGLDRRDVGKAVQPLGMDAKLADRLQAAA
jgi:hypothetical protein